VCKQNRIIPEALTKHPGHLQSLRTLNLRCSVAFNPIEKGAHLRSSSLVFYNSFGWGFFKLGLGRFPACEAKTLQISVQGSSVRSSEFNAPAMRKLSQYAVASQLLANTCAQLSHADCMLQEDFLVLSPE